MKKFLSIMIAAIMAITSIQMTTISALAADALSYDYNAETSTLTITGEGNMSKVSNYAWSSKKTNTKDIIISDTVTSITDYAFSGFDAVENISIGSGVTSISDYALMDLDSLLYVNVDNNNTKYCSANGVLYTKDKDMLIKYPEARTGEYTVCNNTSIIYRNAFKNTNLEKIVLPESVNCIKAYSMKSETLKQLYIYNTKCKIYSDSNIPSTTAIYGYDDSTASEYCANFNHEFVSIGHICTNYLKEYLYKATPTKNGRIEYICSKCGEVYKTTTIYAAKTVYLPNNIEYIIKKKSNVTDIKLKDSSGKYIDSSNYSMIVKDSSGKKITTIEKAGKYTVSFTLKGDYTGTITKTFITKPKEPTLCSYRTNKSDVMSLYFSASNVKGYQVQYSINSNFTNAKTINTTAKSKRVTGLNSKKKYYVRARAYVVIDGKKVYSKWTTLSKV